MTLYKAIADEGYDWRGVTKALPCTRQEFQRWQEEGKFPPPDGAVFSHTFTSMSRAYDHMADGWHPEIIEKVKPLLEGWRTEYKEKLKAERRKKKEVA